MPQQTTKPDSQEARILALLRSNGAAWTPAPELACISLQYCRAINSLRKSGQRIENKVERHGKDRHGFYRLASPSTSAPPTTPFPIRNEVSAAIPESLFGNIAPRPMAYYED